MHTRTPHDPAQLEFFLPMQRQLEARAGCIDLGKDRLDAFVRRFCPGAPPGLVADMLHRAALDATNAALDHRVLSYDAIAFARRLRALAARMGAKR